MWNENDGVIENTTDDKSTSVINKNTEKNDTETDTITPRDTAIEVENDSTTKKEADIKSEFETERVAEAESETEVAATYDEKDKIDGNKCEYGNSHYTSYCIDEEAGIGTSSVKKKHKRAGYIFKAIAAGLAFGLFAFGAMRGMAAIFPEKKVEIKETKTATNDLTAVNVASSSNTVYDVSSVASEVMPAVVSISCSGTQTVNSFFGQQQYPYTSAGTGIIVGSNDTELLIATNNHVINGADTIEISFSDGNKANALIKGASSDVDLAVAAVKLSDLSEDTQNAIKIATLGDSDVLNVGEPSIAIGNALGYGQSVTSGIISALNREVTVQTDETYGFGNSQSVTSYLIQTDAAINPGNSGGPLLNSKGEVIGINSVKYSDSSVEGMGYAIPINKALPILEDFMSRETKTKVAEEQQSYMGIKGTNVDSEAAEVYGMPIGVYVAKVVEDTGAAEAGIQRGDIITKVAGTSISTMTDLQNELQYHAAGTTIDVTVSRNTNGEYKSVKLDIKLGSIDDVDE